MNAAIIEKDFWVCLTLDYLFHHCKWKQAFAFKGGTSLSKVYGLIDRFSEDIDLILTGALSDIPIMSRGKSVPIHSSKSSLRNRKIGSSSILRMNSFRFSGPNCLS